MERERTVLLEGEFTGDVLFITSQEFTVSDGLNYYRYKYCECCGYSAYQGLGEDTDTPIIKTIPR